VILVSYNSHADLLRCLPILLADLPSDGEVIVVDNASTDASTEMIEAHFPHVRLIRAATNTGFTGGNNLGAVHARGEFLAFLNPDTIVTSGWLKALIDRLDADPAIGLVGSKIVLLDDPARLNTYGNRSHFTGLTMCEGLNQPAADYVESQEVAAISGCAFAVRRSTFDALCGFDERLFLYMDDIDLSWRARLAGFRCVIEPASVVLHDYALMIGPKKTFYETRNRWIMLLKTLRWSTLALLAPALLATEMIAWGFALIRDRARWRNLPRAYDDLFRQWRSIMADRRRVQSARRISDRRLLALCAPTICFRQAGDSIATRLAGIVFNPFFSLYHRLLTATVRR
jgi:hypothetical protein